MTLREPLVIITGQVQQLPSGDTINGAAKTTFTATSNGSTINKCMAVYVDVNDSVKKASANSAVYSVFAGFVADASIASGNAGNIQFTGVLTATTGQWDAVTGESGGLVAGTTYYLSPTASGNITLNVPASVNQYILPVGIGINTTDLNIYQRASILL